MEAHASVRKGSREYSQVSGATGPGAVGSDNHCREHAFKNEAQETVVLFLTWQGATAAPTASIRHQACRGPGVCPNQPGPGPGTLCAPSFHFDARATASIPECDAGAMSGLLKPARHSLVTHADLVP